MQFDHHVDIAPGRRLCMFLKSGTRPRQPGGPRRHQRTWAGHAAVTHSRHRVGMAAKCLQQAHGFFDVLAVTRLDQNYRAAGCR